MYEEHLGAGRDRPRVCLLDDELDSRSLSESRLRIVLLLPLYLRGTCPSQLIDTAPGPWRPLEWRAALHLFTIRRAVQLSSQMTHDCALACHRVPFVVIEPVCSSIYRNFCTNMIIVLDSELNVLLKTATY
ncbi:hypothetical protein LshimejAT787_1201960 [Lyophyllum shimeji]|uniref:Uncharacterized protein n=1 Tax=Lyophyllum shimeji TaxID=47721 RepID=A0A9P3US02_LYOSH|nr:hypothetical protein LshimejAT787_1201960 [Lyophyllum shimeji]